jgi:hypothetical protein
MPNRALTDLIVALLHEVTGPRHRRNGRRGARLHHRTVAAPASPPPPPPLATPHCRVLKRPPSPSPDRLANKPLVLSDPDAHPSGRQGGPCAVLGWDCPSRVALVHGPSSSSHQGEGEGGEEEDDERQISLVIGPIGAPAIHETARISIGPQGRPQGPLAPWTATTPPTSPTPSLATSGPQPALPSSEADPSSSGTPLDLKSPCGNRLLCQFTHHAAPSGKGRAPESWDSTAEPSR